MRAIPPETREEVRKLERKHAENPEGRYFVPLANALRKAGDTPHARALLREGLEKHPDYVSAHIVLARCLLDDGDLPEAEARFRHVLTLDPQNLVALRAMGDIAADGGRPEDARKWFGLLLEVDPMNEEARIALDRLPPSAPGGGSAPSSAEEVAGAATETLPLPEGSADDESPFSANRSADFGEAPRPEPEPERTAEDLAGSATSTPGRADDGGQVDPVMWGSTDRLDGHEIHDRGRGETDLERFGGYGDEGLEEEGTVITETIAELYVRQGFYGRAVSVYQELIRRRGPDVGLEERLERARRLAAGESDEVTTAVDVTTGEVSLPQDATGAVSEDDPFAESFTEGFPAPVPPGFEATGAAEEGPRELEAPSSLTENRPEARGIADYLRAVLAWTPRAPTTPAAAAGEAPPSVEEAAAGESPSRRTENDHSSSADDPSGEHDFVEGYAWSEPSDVPLLTDVPPAQESGLREEAGTDAGRLVWSEPDEDTSVPEDQTRAPSTADDQHQVAESERYPSSPSTGDEDLFPWELPVQRQESRESEFAADRPTEVDLAADRMPTSPEPPVEGAPTRDSFEIERAESPSSPSTDRPRASDEDDDDLESFQAWLRSLKR